MIKIKRQKGFVYQARVQLPNGSIESRCFERKKDAELWQSDLRRKISLEGMDFLNLNPSITVSSACEEWLNRKVFSQKSHKTVLAYNGSVSKYIKPWLGEELIGNLREAHGDVFIKMLIEKKLHPKTINNHLMVLKAILKFCVNEGWIRKTPFAKVSFLDEPEPVFDYLNNQEIGKLLSYHQQNTSLYSLLLIALNTGMREGEICGLCWDSVCLETRQIHVRRIYTDKGLMDTTKTKRRRFVPINNVLYAFLKNLEARKLDPKYVTVSHLNKPWVPSHVSNRVLTPALKAADIRPITFHTLRHTFASHFMMNGGSIYDLQKILGHSKVEMTMRYAHLCPDYLVKASNVVSFSGSEKVTLPDSDHIRLVSLK